MGNTLGVRIQEELNRKGYTRKQFSDLTGITEAALSRYITDQREPKALTLSIIAKNLDVSMDDLLGVPSRDTEDIDGAVRLVARSTDRMTSDQKRMLIEALMKY